MERKVWKQRLLSCGLAVWLFGCASSPTNGLNSLRVGMDKDKVLEIAGNPKNTFRREGQDHWLYTYYQNDKEWRRAVIFVDNTLVKVSRPLAKEDWINELEATDTMEEYEQKAREHQKTGH